MIKIPSMPSISGDTGLLPETLTQCRRIVADGGTIVSQKWMDRVIRTLRAQGIYSSCKFLGDANFAVKKDGAGAVSTLYDISGNNNDAVQATGAKQPIWTAGVQNGKAGLAFDGSNDYVVTTYTPDLNPSTANWTFLAWLNPQNPALSLAFAGFPVGSNQRLYFAIDGISGDKWLFNTSEGGVGDSILSLAAASFNVWNNFIITLNGNGTATMWINGISQGNLTGIDSYTTTGALSIGATGAGLIPILALISFVSIYNCTLTTAQRQAMESLINSYFQIY